MRASHLSYHAEDVLLLLLTTVSGPLLWWAATSWATEDFGRNTTGPVEQIIAISCAVLGTIMCGVGLFSLLTGLFVIVVLRTKAWRISNAVWQTTPEFMQRLVTTVARPPGLMGTLPGEEDVEKSSQLWSGGGVNSTFGSVENHSLQSWKPFSPPPDLESGLHESNETPRVITVRTGDSLWSIAAAELGSDATELEIDRRWRDWWAHNPTTIGESPYHLNNGTVLEVPPWV